MTLKTLDNGTICGVDYPFALNVEAHMRVAAGYTVRLRQIPNAGELLHCAVIANEIARELGWSDAELEKAIADSVDFTDLTYISLRRFYINNHIPVPPSLMMFLQLNRLEEASRKEKQ